MRIAVLLALAGCTKYAHTTTVNAPGNVDITTPMPRENGDPARFEPAQHPGTKSIVVFAIPNFLAGTGRLPTSDAVLEPGIEFRFERGSSDKEWHRARFGITTGFGLVQIYKEQGAELGAFHAELNYRFPSIKKVVPMDIGLGPVFYPDNPEAGVQLSWRFMLLTARARYMTDSGFEFWGGYEIPIPFEFRRSK